jgi:crotonobetainyl-CoA:carnitine CoA-transferase CaiB-like acyl-CoA transferase
MGWITPRSARSNPGLVYCSITGFGQTGPYSQRAGYDFVIQAMGGLMSITGQSDDQPGGGAQKCGVPISDLMTGMYASVAIVSALFERTRSGQGQYIDMSLLDTQVAWLANQASNYLVSGTTPKRWGNAHPNLAPLPGVCRQRRRTDRCRRQRPPVCLSVPRAGRRQPGR